MRFPRALIFCLATAWLPAAGPAFAQSGGTQPPDVRRILARAEQVYEDVSSLRARFQQVIEVPILQRRREGSGTWYQKGRGRFRMDFSDPEGDEIVADGSHLWLYYPSTHPGQVIRSRIDANPTGSGMVDLQGRIFDEASRAYEAELEGRERIGDVDTWRIRLTPRGDSPYRRVRVWVDREDLLVRKFEITERNETVRTVVLDAIERDPALPDSIFRFRPPPGTDVFEG